MQNLESETVKPVIRTKSEVAHVIAVQFLHLAYNRKATSLSLKFIQQRRQKIPILGQHLRNPKYEGVREAWDSPPSFNVLQRHQM